MSDNFTKMKSLMETLVAEYTKFDGGNNAAGTRARKALQEIKGTAQALRVEIQDKKNSV